DDCIGGVGANAGGLDVEAGGAQQGLTQRTEGVEGPIVRRVLGGQDVEAGVEVVEQGGRRADEVVRVGGGDDVWVRSRVRVSARVGEVGVSYDRTRVGVDAEVLVAVTDDAESVDRGVEVDAEIG